MNKKTDNTKNAAPSQTGTAAICQIQNGVSIYMANLIAAAGWLLVFSALVSVTVTTASPSTEPFDKPAVSLPGKLLIWAVGIGGNALLFPLLHYLFFNTWHFFDTVQAVAAQTIPYQKLYFAVAVLALWIVCALLLGASVAAFLRSRHPTEDAVASPAARYRKKKILLLDGSCLALALIGAFYFCYSGVHQLRINEIASEKVSGLPEQGYVELRSEGFLPCQVEGLYLSDDEHHLRQYQIPAFTVAPGALLLIPVDKDVVSLSKAGGDVLILSDGFGNIIDKVTVKDARQEGFAYGWSVSDQKWCYMPPSPGEANSLSDIVLKKPSFSQAPGYYKDAFDVTIAADFLRQGGEIRYTTDGSKPTPDSPLYTGAIHVYDRSSEPNRWRSVKNVVYDWQNAEIDTTPVAKAFVLRAVAIDANGTQSAEAVASYFVGEAFNRDRAVVSVVADEDDLFGEDGIYTTGKTYDAWYLGGQKGDRPTANFDVHGTERPANVEFFKDGKTLYFGQKAGLRIQGGSTRWLPLKRFSLFARKGYAGSNTFDKEIFEGKSTHSVTLRTGFENAFSMICVPDRDVAVQQSIPVTVYLNGEYWYDTYMQEKYNNTFFRQTYGIRDAEFYKTGITDEIKDYLDSHNLAIQNYYEEFGQMVDIQSYIDYICSNVYLANTDYSEYGNVGIWRTTYKENDSYGDGRWRWCLYDMDLQTAGCRQNYGMTDITDAQLDSFNIVCDWDPPVNERLIYKSLKANPDFCKQFVLSFMDIVNTDFTVERMTELLEEWGEDISFHEYFFRDRAQNMEVFLAKEFGLKGKVQTLTVTVSDPEGGTVTVNTCRPDLSGGTWTGRYFTDYPVTVTAAPHPGYVFKGWTGDDQSTDQTIEINLNGGAALHAVFEKE